MSKKPASPIWAHFLRTSTGKVKCTSCSWESVPNATRMQAHWLTHCKSDDDVVESSQSTSSQQSEATVETAAKKQRTLGEHLDRALTKGQHERAQKLLAFACITNGWSHNSLQQAPFKAFCKAIRCGMKILMELIFHYFLKALISKFLHRIF